MTPFQDPRRVLNSAIFLLSLLVLLLTAGWAWQGYTKYRDAERVVAVNRLANTIIGAASKYAVERGITSAALGASGPADATVRTHIEEIRAEADRAWTGARAAAQNLSSQLSGRGFLQLRLDQAEQAFRALQDVRRAVDQELQAEEPRLDTTTWRGAVTEFIRRTAHLREATLTAVDQPWSLSQLNHGLEDQVWQAAEGLGRERGALAYYISAAQAVSAEDLEELRANRAAVSSSLKDIRALRGHPNTDPHINAAIDRMDEELRARFEPLRERVYAESSRGTYTITGADWLTQATAAINSIWGIAGAATALSANMAEKAMERAKYQFAALLALLLLTAVLMAVNVSKVRQIAYELFHRKELAEVTLHSIGDAVITTDAAARVTFMNPVAEKLVGWTTANARGQRLADVFPIVNRRTRESEPNPIERCLVEGRVVTLNSETVLLRPDGSEILVEDSAAPIRDRSGEIVGAVLVFYDVTVTAHAPQPSYQSREPLTPTT